MNDTGDVISRKAQRDVFEAIHLRIPRSHSPSIHRVVSRRISQAFIPYSYLHLLHTRLLPNPLPRIHHHPR